MSRTYRKRSERFESYNRSVITGRPIWTDDIVKRKALYYTEKYDSWVRDTLPKAYRKVVNKKRRAMDKIALHNEIYKDIPSLYCDWNCKTNDHWSYF